MKNLKKNTKGITLVTLVITIVVLLILASIATYSGIEVIKSSRLTTFTTEMKIMQTQVNELYQKYKDGDSTVLDLGKDLNIVSEQANKVLNASGTAETEQNEYRYFDQDTIKNLKIEGVEGEFFINIKTRRVVSYEGFKYDDRIYYTLEQLPNGLYNVEYTDTNEGIDSPTFDTSVEKISEGKWRVTVSNIQYNGYINKWQIKYKLNGQDYWDTSEDLSLVINQEGEYRIKIVNGNVESDEKIIVFKYSDNTSTILPNEYQQVEYIESNGTQYIDTGIIPDENYGFYVDIYFDVNIDTNSPSIKILGSSLRNNGAWGGVTLSSYGSTSGGQMTWFSKSGQLINPYLASKTRMQCYFVNDIYSTSLDNSTTSIPKSVYDNICGSIYLFAIHSEEGVYFNTTSCLKIYEYKTYNNSDVVQDFIPCYRKSDNEIGMYDTVNNKFYTNQGTGTFKKGNDEND